MSIYGLKVVYNSILNDTHTSLLVNLFKFMEILHMISISIYYHHIKLHIYQQNNKSLIDVYQQFGLLQNRYSKILDNNSLPFSALFLIKDIYNNVQEHNLLLLLFYIMNMSICMEVKLLSFWNQRDIEFNHLPYQNIFINDLL